MTNKSKKILAEISAGELLDKISILEIKLDKIKDKKSHEEVMKEYNILKNILKSSVVLTSEVNDLFKSLKEINLKLWETEDSIRIFEKDKNFGNDFIELARKVYLNNDKRSKIKSKINKLLGSNIKEIKQYANY